MAGADTTKDDDPITVARERFKAAEEAWFENRRDALDDVRFARLEEQWPEEVKCQRLLDRRPVLTLNQLHPIIFQLVNDARQNKPNIDVHPVGDGADQEVAEILNGMIRHIWQTSDGDLAVDTAFDAAVSGGFGFFRIGTRYANDYNFDQELTVEPIDDAFAAYPDPDTSVQPLEWNEFWLLHRISKVDFEKRWPDRDAVSFDSEPRTEGRRTEEDEIQYAEQWLREPVIKTLVALSPISADTMQGQPEQADKASGLMGDHLVVDEEVYKEHRDLFDALGVEITAKREAPGFKVTQRLLSGSEVLEKVDWKGSYIPVIPVFGEVLMVEGKRYTRSLIRGAKDAQQMFNYWQTTATEMVALQPKAPYIGEEGAFGVDPEKWDTANTDNHAYLEYAKNTQRPERQPFAGVPSGIMQQAEAARQNIQSIIGIYNSSLGAASNETSGIAINARDSQADTGTFHFIDNLNRAIRHAGRIMIDLIPEVYPTPRIVQTLDPDGSVGTAHINQPQPVTDPQTGQPVMVPGNDNEMVALTKIMDVRVGNYDVAVKSGPSYATQREQMVSMLQELIRAEPSLAPIVGDIFVKNFDIPDADEIVQRIQAMSPQNPKLKEAQQTIQQGTIEIANLKLEIAKLRADKTYDAGKLAIDAFDAQTDRMQAVAPQGIPQALDPNALHGLVLSSMRMILSNPEMLLAGDLAVDPALGGSVQPQAQPGAELQPNAPSIAA